MDNTFEVKIKTEDGSYLSGKEAMNYIEEEYKRRITVEEPIQIGDVVILKNIEEEVTIEGKLEDTSFFLGTVDGIDESLIVAQSDVESIVSRGKKR